jgi:glutamine synthetase
MIKKYTLEYVWYDAKQNFRSKRKIINLDNLTMNNIPEWNYDGSSTGQATGHDSEILLQPFTFIKSPFEEDNDVYYVFCETYKPNGEPALGNTRPDAVKYFSKTDVIDAKPMFGMEQEFYVFKNGTPVVWSDNPEPQGNYYCGFGVSYIGDTRKFLDEMLEIFKKMGFNVTGSNFEVGPGQMEIQLCENGLLGGGLLGADRMVMMRFFMILFAEKNGYDISFMPKPDFLGSSKWNGSGCHVNFSTEKMRKKHSKSPLSAVKEIAKTIYYLQQYHKEDIPYFGSENNKLRLTGENETSCYDKFTYGIAHRGSSTRIPRQCVKDLEGYVEDRRPGADMDPYLVLPRICEAGVLMPENKEDKDGIIKIMNDILNVHISSYM